MENALISAARQAFGVTVISTQKAQNDKLVLNDLIQQSAGIVNKYEVLHCENASGYHCQVRALAFTQPLMVMLEKLDDQNVEVDGGSEFAKQVSEGVNPV